MKELKVHYAYSDAESPEGASYCTPKTARRQVTENPEEVTCQVCQQWSRPDVEDEKYFKELKRRPWYYGLFYRNKGPKLLNMASGLASLLDVLVTLLSLGCVSSSFQFKLVIGYSLPRQARLAEKEKEREE